MFRLIRNPDPRKKPPYGSRIDPTHPLAQGLVGCWLFNEGGGNNTHDVIFMNTCTISGAAWKGSGLSFNGSSDYGVVNLVDLSDTNVVTVSFLMQWNTYDNNDSLAFEFSTNFNDITDGFLVDPDSGDPYSGYYQIALKGDAGYNSAGYTRPSAGPFITYTVVFDKGQSVNEVDLYLDGKIQTPIYRLATNNNTNNFGKLPLYIMSRAGSSLFGNGQLDYIFIHKKRLSDPEIMQLHAEPYSFTLVPQYWYMVDFGAVGGGTYDVSFSLAQSFAISDQATADAQAAVTLSQGLAVSDQSSAVAEALTSLSKSLNVTIQADAIAEGTLSLAVQLAVSLASEVVGEIVGQVSLTQVLGLALASDAQAQAALTLAYNAALSTAGTVVTEGVLSLAIQKGLTTSYVVTQEAVLSLAQALGLSSTATAAAEGQVALAKILAVSVLGQALAEAGVSLDQVVSVTLIGTTIIAGFETPDGRKYTISVEVRTMDIEAESRTLVISPENRTVTIN